MYRDRLEEDVKKWFYKRPLNEETSTGGSSGSFKVPLSPGMRIWDKETLDPFTVEVSKYLDAMLAYDSYDGKMDEPKKKISKIEKRAEKISIKAKNNPQDNDDDGDNLNQYPGKHKTIVPIVTESNTSVTAGVYTAPVELGLKKWSDKSLKPFIIHSDHHINKKSKEKNLKNNINRVVGVWEKNPDGTYDQDVHDVHTVNEWVEITEDTIVEDLGVWFGTKKKPKGSKQPKGPWVNICRHKEGGGHPPCGRPTAYDKGYPKCRAAGVAAKMTDAQKKSACQQKRKAEKTHSKAGKGNSPKMVHYEPKKKKNESFHSLLTRIISEVLSK
jgi:hypothetical protein